MGNCFTSILKTQSEKTIFDETQNNDNIIHYKLYFYDESTITSLLINVQICT